MNGNFSHVPYVTDYMRVCIERIKQHFGSDLTGRKTLDIPAGNGWISEQLGHMGAEAIAGDINSEKPEYVQTDMEKKLPFSDQEFDVVISAEGIEHVFSPYHLFSELARVLKPGGILIITTPNLQNLITRWQFLCCGYPYQFDPFNKIPLADGVMGDKGHISPVSYMQLRYFAESHGLTTHRPMGGDVKERALKLLVFFPFLLWGLFWVWRDWQKTSKDPARLEILKHLFSWKVLHSRSLIFVCTKD